MRPSPSMLRWGLLALVVAATSPAWAEDGKATESATVYKAAGERSTVIFKLREGEKVDVIDRDGRWLKIRVRGRTGWVMRTAVEVEEEDIARNTRRRPFVDGRSTGRGWSGGTPDDRIGADAIDDSDGDSGDKGDGDRSDPDEDEPRDRDSDRDRDVDEPPPRKRVRVTAKKATLFTNFEDRDEVAATARRGDVLFLDREKGGWYLVETKDGDAGWLKASQVEADKGGDDDGDDDDDDRGGAGKRTIVGTAQLGVKLLGTRFTTAGGANAVPDNYILGVSAASVGIGAEVWFPYSKKLKFGGNLSYFGTKALPGIKYMNVATGLTMHDIDLRALAGYDLGMSNGLLPVARLGYHYELFAISDVEDVEANPAKIPSERYSGVTLGAGVELPRLTPKIGLTAFVDTVLLGSSRVQTKNLEDGASPSSRAIWVGLGGSYAWKNGMAFVGNYELTFVSTDFGDPVPTSQRGHTGTGSERRDVNHTVTFGMNRLF